MTPTPSYDSLDVAVEPCGLHSPIVWFGGGRVGASVASFGALKEIAYFGAQPMGDRCFFRNTEHTPYARLFCPYLLVEDRAWQLEWTDTRVFPAGYESRMEIPEEGIEITHSLVLLNDALVYRVSVWRNDRNLPLRLRLSLHEYLRVIPENRTWGDWESDTVPGAFTAVVTDPVRAPKKVVVAEETGEEQPEPPFTGERASTWIGVVACSLISNRLSTRLFRSGRRYFETEVSTLSDFGAAIVFGKDEAEFRSRAADLQTNGVEISVMQLSRWESQLQAAPTLRLGRPIVESFFRQNGLILDMLMPTDLPGAMRASAGHYWVWGWDTMVYCDSYLVCGQSAFVRDALELYRRTADPVWGVGHQFSEHMAVQIPQALPAQGLYLNMLYQYYAYTGDEAVAREYYPFARTIFQRTLAQGRRENLFKGISLWPDYPQFAGQKGGERDLSIFNNSIFYQAARAMEHLAGALGDVETARAAREAWMAQEQSFRELFWDADRAYWVDSLDSETLEKRRSYPAHALLWINPFARELVAGREAANAAFLAANHVRKGGIRPYPHWDPAFNGDGNQLAQHYPAGLDLFFLKTMAATGNQELLQRWLSWLETSWSNYTVPEGLTLEAENDGPQRPDCPGGKQPFSAKPWQMGLISAIAGVEVDAGGITLGPGLDEPVALARLPFQRRLVAVSSTGAGGYIENIVVNGQPVAGTWKIPADLLTGLLAGEESKEPQIVFHRTNTPPTTPQLLSADGATLSQLSVDTQSVTVQLDAPGAVRIHFFSPGKPEIAWCGKPVPSTYDPATQKGSALLQPEAATLNGKLEIRQG